jgi:hypothetical protein
METASFDPVDPWTGTVESRQHKSPGQIKSFYEA